MTTKDLNVPSQSPAPADGETQPPQAETSSQTAVFSKEESETIAVVSLSLADSVVQTVDAPTVVQATTDDGNFLADAASDSAARAPHKISVQAVCLMDSKLEHADSMFDPLLTTKQIGSYPILDDLQELLGNKVVLIPIPRGQKGPVAKGWQNIKLPQTQGIDYQRALNQGNIGVLLGAPSNGLCAVDIDSDEELEAFLALNPILRGTLITKGARGAQIWCKIDGDYPPLTKLKTESGQDFGEWRAEGGQSVIHGTHPTGVPYQRLNNAPPVIISFSQIVWPGHVKLPWAKDAADLLAEQYGPAYKFEGCLKINEFHLAAKFKTERRVLWEPLEREFYSYDAATGLWKGVSTETLKFQLGLDLKRVGDQTGVDDFNFIRTDGRMGGLINTLKGMVEEKDAFKKNANKVIHCSNGMLALDSSPPELRTFHPDYRSRKCSSS